MDGSGTAASGTPVRVLLGAVAAAVLAGCAATPPPPVVPAPVPAVATPAAGPTAVPGARPSSGRPTARRTVPAVTLATFAGHWNGHDRGLSVSASGVGHETVADGCCTPEIDMTFRLSNPRGRTGRPVATATLTAVALYALPGPAPAVGRTFTVSLIDGVLTEDLAGTTFCDRAATARGDCGA